jgi:hypothetical protein
VLLRKRAPAAAPEGEGAPPPAPSRKRPYGAA